MLESEAAATFELTLGTGDDAPPEVNAEGMAMAVAYRCRLCIPDGECPPLESSEESYIESRRREREDKAAADQAEAQRKREEEERREQEAKEAAEKAERQRKRAERDCLRESKAARSKKREEMRAKLADQGRASRSRIFLPSVA